MRKTGGHIHLCHTNFADCHLPRIPVINVKSQKVLSEEKKAGIGNKETGV
jgi:hypothetical protein